VSALLALLLIGLAAIFQAAFLLRRENPRDPASPWMLLAASVLLLETLVQRSIRMQFAAVTNLYESLVLFSAAICALLFTLRRARRTRDLHPLVMFGATLISLGLLMISSSPLAPREIQPPVPALRSLWLVLHVAISFIGESFFAVGFVAGIGWLLARKPESRAAMERLTVTAIGIGYPVYTLGALVFGAIWAEAAWGTWWSWDPKETWALVTWLIYTAWLHTRLVKKLRGTISAILAIAGFLAALFTYFGVSFLLPGLHGYR